MDRFIWKFGSFYLDSCIVPRYIQTTCLECFNKLILSILAKALIVHIRNVLRISLSSDDLNTGLEERCYMLA